MVQKIPSLENYNFFPCVCAFVFPVRVINREVENRVLVEPITQTSIKLVDKFFQRHKRCLNLRLLFEIT